MPESRKRTQSCEDYAFLQVLMKKGFMSVDSARDLLERLHGDANRLEQLLSALNERVREHSFGVQKMLSMLDKQEYIAFINKDGDDAGCKMASHFSQPQREFFKAVLEGIALSGESPELGGLISSTDALNIQTLSTLSQAPLSQNTSFKSKLTKRDMEATLEQLVAEGWLASCSEYTGYYSIGVRSFMELKRYLMSLPLPEATKEEWSKVL
ncbi:hypothetical protein BSKO_00181 [Bryopsis sp. KO-2023]|nr:hypothetical protein BSKO_00181 [Bryopsis sp. KO-2023]